VYAGHGLRYTVMFMQEDKQHCTMDGTQAEEISISCMPNTYTHVQQT